MTSYELVTMAAVRENICNAAARHYAILETIRESRSIIQRLSANADTEYEILKDLLDRVIAELNHTQQPLSQLTGYANSRIEILAEHVQAIIERYTHEPLAGHNPHPREGRKAVQVSPTQSLGGAEHAGEI